MGSKKTLFIILIVGLAIFVISLAIGRPWWKALLFSIGFLLIAAIVSTRGLLIPEGLLDMRLPRRPPFRKSPEDADKTGEAAKAKFLGGMESTLADLSKGATAEDAQWTTDYTRVMKGVGELAHEVHESVRSKDRAKQLGAFRKAVKQLPQFISEFEIIPEPTTRKRQKTMKRQAQGMDLYLQGCSNFVQALETSDGDLAGEAAMQISQALDFLDLMGKSSATFGRR